MTMTDLPPLFEPKNGGKFAPYDADMLATLTPERQTLYQDVADAAANLERVESDLKNATDHVAECVRGVSDAEKQMPKAPTFHELWRQTFGRPNLSGSGAGRHT
jgi:hypothetical protein